MSNLKNKVKFNNEVLVELTKIMRRNKAFTKIGIIGDGVQRKDGEGISNAEVGAHHEFGTEGVDGYGGLPMRSFLRMPLTEKLQSHVKKNGVTNETMEKVVKQKSLGPILKNLGLLGETIIGNAFDTGGFGSWPKSNFKLKKNHQTLVETQDLRNSISSEVKKK